jgi:uridine phosphorylase
VNTIIDTYDSDREAIIMPKRITDMSGGVKELPEIAIATWSGHSIPVAIERFGAVQIDTFVAGMEYSIYVIEYMGKKITFYFSPVGGASSAAILEEMIIKGVQKFVFYGSCGVLNRELTAKSLIVPTTAYRDEGTSYHYAPASTYIDVRTAPRLIEILDEIKLPYVQGKTWTTDAFYRETKKNMEKRKADGCLTVEMECASIMAAAQFRGVDCYQFIYAADSLDAVEWDSRTLGKLTNDVRENFLRIALEVAIRI